MAQLTPALKYQVSEGIFDTKSCLDEENFYHQKQGLPSELTSKMTYIMGNYFKSYPISLMTMGKVGFDGNDLSSKAVKELDDIQFTYPVMGRLRKACVTSKTIYSGSDTPGIGNSEFKLYFSDNYIKRFFIIQSHNGVQAHVRKDLEMVGGHWEATCVLDPASPTDYCDLSQITEGASWVPLYAAVPESLSRSTETSMATPGSYKNQMGVIRAGMSWAGNTANKIMRVELESPKGKTKVWFDHFMWQFENEWLNNCEAVYWYSRYNRLENGQIPLKDLLTGKVIPRGSGILEQIQNKSTYSRLSYDFISKIIGDALYGQPDADGSQITFYGGRGFMREFHRAVAEKSIGLVTSFEGIGDKFITGSGRNLMLGGFFDGFYHIDGYIVKAKHNPLFDHGAVAIGQTAGGNVHPETGWPMESYRGVFIDDGDYDGQPNIQAVAQKGRIFRHGVVLGMSEAPASINIMQGNYGNDTETGAALKLASDLDESSYTRLKTSGIQILRANRCFDLICTAGMTA